MRKMVLGQALIRRRDGDLWTIVSAGRVVRIRCQDDGRELVLTPRGILLGWDEVDRGEGSVYVGELWRRTADGAIVRVTMVGVRLVGFSSGAGEGGGVVLRSEFIKGYVLRQGLLFSGPGGPDAGAG